MSRKVEFWSSVECGAFQRALERQLCAQGWLAEARFGVGLADYWNARRGVSRLLVRLRAYGLYPARLALRAAVAPRDLTAVITSNTFFAPRVGQAFGRGRFPVVHWVFDLFPDVLVASGALKENSGAARALRGIMRQTFQQSAANVFLGEHLRQFAEERFGPVPRVYVVPVGADGAPFRDRSPQPLGVGKKPRVLYCGNLGRMHDTDTVVNAIRSGLDDGVELAFHGNGIGFSWIREALRGNGMAARVTLEGNLDDPDWAAAMLAADVALVTLKAGAEGLVMPSKTYSAMVAGQAILAVCRRNSDLAALVTRHECGWVVEPGDSEGLLRVWRMIATRPSEVLDMRRRAYEAGHRHYDMSVVALQWSALLDEVAQSHAR